MHKVVASAEEAIQDVFDGATIMIGGFGLCGMPENLIQQAAEIVLAPLRKAPPAGLVIDLSQVRFFGSVFISFLLKCHMLAKRHGSEIVLAGASARARELLHLTALDTLWAIYDNLDEALEALDSD